MGYSGSKPPYGRQFLTVFHLGKGDNAPFIAGLEPIHQLAHQYSGHQNNEGNAATQHQEKLAAQQ